MNASARPPADMTTPLGSPEVLFAFDSFTSGAVDIDGLAERLYECCSEDTAAIGDALALLDHHHRLGALGAEEVELITSCLEHAAREAPATGPGELSAFVSGRLGLGSEQAPSKHVPIGHTVAMPAELRADVSRPHDGRRVDPSLALDTTRAFDAPWHERSEPSIPDDASVEMDYHSPADRTVAKDPPMTFDPLIDRSAPDDLSVTREFSPDEASFGEQPLPSADEEPYLPPEVERERSSPRFHDAVSAEARAAREHTHRPVGPGMVLRNRYVLERELGSGGMGTVYRALDRNRLGLPEEIRSIAVKVLHPELAARPDALQTLRQEFYQAQSLSHPGIVNVFDFDQDGHVHFLTMELLEGELLSDLLARIQPNKLRRDVAGRLLRDLGAAVVYAHAHGVLHRDLKPGNVMVSRQGAVRVLDFGLGQFHLREPWISTNEASFDAVTPTYASFERLTGRYPDSRDDVFSFACIAYEVLAGRHPFDRKPATEARERRMRLPRVRHLSHRQWKALRSGLAWDREDRPGTLFELLDGLGLETPPEAESVPAAFKPGGESRRMLAGLGAAAVIALAAGAAYQRRDDLAPVWQTATERARELGNGAVSGVQSQLGSLFEEAPGAAPPASTPTVSAENRATTTVSDVPAVGLDEQQRVPSITPAPDIASGPSGAAGEAAAAIGAASAAGEAAAATGAPSAAAEAPSATQTSPPAGEPKSANDAAASAGLGAGPGRLSLTTGNLPVSESATTARLLVRRSGGAAGTVSFEWRTIDDSAQAGVDYAGMPGRRETLRPGQTTAELIIPLVGDSVRESTKLFDVAIDDFTGGARAGSITRATIVIVDDD